MSTIKFPEFTNLLRDFSKLPRKSRSKTFLEISQFPHDEIACSNILAFFLDPHEEHGLGSLCLNSLLTAAGLPAHYEFRSTTVDREVATDEGKRLDIVIVAEGEVIVGIENKLFHSAEQNPYPAYSELLEQMAKEHELPSHKVHKILLSLRREDEAARSGFVPVTYRSFFEQLEKQLGAKLIGAELRFVGYLMDFMKTITSLEKGTTMDDETLKFFRQQGKTAVDFYYKTRELLDELEEKVNRARGALGDLPPEAKVGLGRFDSECKKEPDKRAEAFCSWMWCGEIAVSDDLVIGLEADLYLRQGKDAWEIYLWSNKPDIQALCDWLKKNGIKPLGGHNGRSSEGVWVYATYDYAESPEVVGKAFKSLIELILSKRSGAIKKKGR